MTEKIMKAMANCRSNFPLYLILEYWPPQGQPASPFTLHGPPRAGDANFTIQINGTWPAVRYQYQLNAVFGTGQRNGTTADTALLHKGIAYSSPDKPVLVSAAATERACTLAWAPPPALHLPKAQQHASDEQLQQSVYNYYMEYFPLYEVHVAWAPGKKVVGSQRVVFRGENISATDGVGKRAEGHVNITGLEPARLYTFAVRNVSREMPSQCSAPLGVRLITPPVVTSTVYAGKISTSSINVNFGESDESHPFEQYELHFASAGDDDAAPMSGGDKLKNGSTTLIRRLAKNDPKSFTFNKLVPGKTYTFSLFTLLHGVRSRPVDANITTYPLKVSGFHPLIGSGYVRLFWTVLNEAHNFCRFRLSYTASAGPHLHSALSLELNGTINTHRFSGLDWNTFYTFTITVIMGPPSAEAESESEATYTFSLFTLLHGVRSRPVDANITTYPLKVSGFHPLIGSGYVRLFWTVLNEAHNFCRFRLSYTASAGPHLHSALSLELNGTINTHRFSGLDWNTFYTFTITVIMGPPSAEAESESEAVTIGMANRPRSTPQLKRYGSRELLLSFENDPEAFPERNGAIKEFAVIVAERVALERAIVATTESYKDKEEEAQNLLETLGDLWELPSWHDARERADDAGDDKPWIAYRTSPSKYNPFVSSHRLDEMYCNGALRANADYFVRVRAYSVEGIAMETAWVGIDGAVPHAVSGKQSPEQKRVEGIAMETAWVGIDGAVPHAVSGKQSPEQKRLPCYMYLNGCNGRERAVGSNAAARISAFTRRLVTFSAAISTLIVMFNQIVHVNSIGTSPSKYNPFARRGSSRLAQFIIGAEDCMPGRHRLDEMYCNGALRANADYFVRVRAYSVEGIAMETAWVGIDGAVPHAVSGKQSPEQKRLPCYMYLNGCNGRERAVGSNAAARISPFTRRLVTFSAAISTLIVMFNQIVHVNSIGR
uniref:Protein-tyrosine-phosphatase n=1 Tax=Globodera pallida TaxID=36090 RepID=A0A183C5R4_GLOPA